MMDLIDKIYFSAMIFCFVVIGVGFMCAFFGNNWFFEPLKYILR